MLKLAQYASKWSNERFGEKLDQLCQIISESRYDKDKPIFVLIVFCKKRGPTGLENDKKGVNPRGSSLSLSIMGVPPSPPPVSLCR